MPLVAEGGVELAEWPSRLASLSIEELMDIEVTSVSRKAESRFAAPAAVHVITREEIRRSGASNLADALRTVPGIQVAQLNGSNWAVSSRGFNGEGSNKLLVLVDGRTVYTTLFAGVFWDAQGTLLEDLDRIEVIRGPGGAVWGANAVNGVINILTRNAHDTQGLMVAAGGGTEERGFLAARYGDRTPLLAYRVFFKAFDRDASAQVGGGRATDPWRQARAGFRLDWSPAEQHEVIVSGEAYDGMAGGNYGLTSPQPPYNLRVDGETPIRGGHLLARWSRLDGHRGARISANTYYDRSERREPFFGGLSESFNLELQHDFRLHHPGGGRHDLTWGLGYRMTRDAVDGTFTFHFTPDDLREDVYSGFVQDRITLRDGRWWLTLGTKLEHNAATGWEVQPSARLLFRPVETRTLWAAASRAVRTPSRFERHARLNTVVIPGELFTFVSVFGDDALRSEEIVAYELGYRELFFGRLSLDLATFVNVYDDLITFVAGEPVIEPFPRPLHLLIPRLAVNRGYGETLGVELATDLEISSRFRMAVSLTYLENDLRSDERSSTIERDSGRSPRFQAHLRSSLNLGRSTELDVNVSFIDELPILEVEERIRFDLRLGWRPTDRLELSLTGQNLSDSQHIEFRSFARGIAPTEVERSVHGRLTWRF